MDIMPKTEMKNGMKLFVGFKRLGKEIKDRVETIFNHYVDINETIKKLNVLLGKDKNSDPVNPYAYLIGALKTYGEKEEDENGEIKKHTLKFDGNSLSLGRRRKRILEESKVKEAIEEKELLQRCYETKIVLSERNIERLVEDGLISKETYQSFFSNEDSWAMTYTLRKKGDRVVSPEDWHDLYDELYCNGERATLTMKDFEGGDKVEEKK